MNHYVFPVLGRAGLGNMLFPWARAVVLAQNHHMELIRPSWWRPRLGPYLRQERDKREYGRFLGGPSVVEYIRGQQIVHSCTMLDEQGAVLKRRRNDVVVVVKGMDSYFEPLLGAAPVVLHSFRKLAPRCDAWSEWQPRSNAVVAVHIRLGDFMPPAPTVQRGVARRNQATPMAWFEAVIRSTAMTLPDARFVVYSDGADEQLGSILSMPRIRRSTWPDPISDLVAMASADLIIGSGSTYSAWASFLGSTPILFASGANHYLRSAPNASEGDEFPTDVLSAVRQNSSDGSLGDN